MRPASLRTVYPGPGGFDPQVLKREFPIFASNPGLVFLDSGASAQKPRSVIDRISNYYSTDYANVHRGVYRLSARSTELFEEAREKMRAFLNAAEFARDRLRARRDRGHQPRRSELGRNLPQSRRRGLDQRVEHHSNIVPWQLLRDRIGIRLVVAPIDATGGLDLAAFEGLLSPRTRLVAMTHLANATGALVPIETVTRLAHRHGAKVLIDGCQAAPRLTVDVQALDCDFYVFSGHKTYGPTGIGVLYGRYELLSAMPPWQGGGEMILNVTFEKSEFQEPRTASRLARRTFQVRSGSARRLTSSRSSGATTSWNTRRR